MQKELPHIVYTAELSSDVKRHWEYNCINGPIYCLFAHFSKYCNAKIIGRVLGIEHWLYRWSCSYKIESRDGGHIVGRIVVVGV